MNLHEKALFHAQMQQQTMQTSNVYGSTNLANNVQNSSLSSMENLQNVTLMNRSTVERMKRKIIVRKDPRVHESITLNTLS